MNNYYCEGLENIFNGREKTTLSLPDQPLPPLPIYTREHYALPRNIS